MSDDDTELVERARGGSKDALRALVERHQPYVYNIALKMFGAHQDAEDLTQEVLIRAITALDSFRGDSGFRTWLYRITVNHFLKTRRRGMELLVDDFAGYFDAVAAVPDEEASDDKTTEELRLRCTTGMLMCLDRDQRVTFILGAMFGVSHTVAGEILGISPGNFRVRLHRARADLYSWMNARCGLVNAANPCRCAKKTRGYIARGAVDPEQLRFNTDYVVRIEALTREGAREAMETVDDLHERVFLDHPFQVSRQQIVDEILGNETLRRFFDVS
jgi:RNA polymerase sigma factor (sigma-70 family)